MMILGALFRHVRQPISSSVGWVDELQTYLPSTELQPLIEFPKLCRQAQVHQITTTHPLTEVWQISYTALYIFDKVAEDNARLIAPTFPSSTINIGMALLLAACHNFHDAPASDQLLYQQAANEFYRTLAQMSVGQHFALTQQIVSLEESWQLAQWRSGIFFALGSWLGTRLATHDKAILNAMRDFGEQVGLLVQIGNDASGVHPQTSDFSDLRRGERRTLPIAYTLETLTDEAREVFLAHLDAAPHDDRALQAARETIITSGALVYLQVKIGVHQQRARQALQRAGIPSDNRLYELVSELGEITPTL